VRRSVWLLLALVAAQLFLISGQLAERAEQSGLLGRGLLAVVVPVGRALDRAADSLAGLRDRLATRSLLLEENRRLRSENLVLARDTLRQRALVGEVERLRRAANYAGAWEGELLTADVVYIDHASWLQTALIVVERAGVRRNQPVVSADGLLGRLVAVEGRYAKVQLLTDRAASVGAMVERTRRQGLVRGAGQGALTLDFIPLQEELAPGDRLLTAGIDGIYPRGLPIGTVASVTSGEGMFHRVEVTPAVDFGRLDQVYVLDAPLLPAAAGGEMLEASP
jgi:rod shape-determining protein MreC